MIIHAREVRKTHYFPPFPDLISQEVWAKTPGSGHHNLFVMSQRALRPLPGWSQHHFFGSLLLSPPKYIKDPTKQTFQHEYLSRGLETAG